MRRAFFRTVRRTGRTVFRHWFIVVPYSVDIQAARWMSCSCTEMASGITATMSFTFDGS